MTTATSGAPWWGTGLFTLGGALLGGLIAAGVAIWLERKRSEREKQSDSGAAARKACVVFLDEVARVYSAMVDPHRVEDRLKIVSRSDLSARLLGVQLTCPADVHGSAGKVWASLVEVGKWNDNSPDDDPVRKVARGLHFKTRHDLVGKVREFFDLETLPAYELPELTKEELERLERDAEADRLAKLAATQGSMFEDLE